jgi:hypothetical protein
MMILLRRASETRTDLDFENNSRITCCFSVTMTFAAFPGIVYSPLKLVKESSFDVVGWDAEGKFEMTFHVDNGGGGSLISRYWDDVTVLALFPVSPSSFSNITGLTLSYGQCQFVPAELGLTRFSVKEGRLNARHYPSCERHSLMPLPIVTGE